MDNNSLIFETIKIFSQNGILLPILVTAMVAPIIIFLIMINFFDVKIKTKKK